MFTIRRRLPARIVALGLAIGCPLAVPSALGAQTDYYNTDAGRPIRTEDAYAIERRALELQIAPVRLERPRGGTYRWGLEPEIAVGLLPRTQVEIGVPLVHAESRAGRRATALAGLEVSTLYTLNAETRLPAFAVAAAAVLPVGAAAPARTIPSLTALATRTFSWARLHANAQVTLANATDVAPTPTTTSPTGTAEFTRWTAGVAIDRTFPLRSLLVTAELVTSEPLVRSPVRRWDAAGGMRYQLSPRLALDAGGGYRLRGDDQGWFVTSGAALALGVPARWRR